MATRKQESAEGTLSLYDKAYLLANAAQFGVCREVLAGALYKVTEPISLQQAKVQLVAFLNKSIGED